MAVTVAVAAHPVDLQEARPRAGKHVHGRKRQFVCTPHEEASKDTAMHVALLRLAGEGVAQARAVHQQRVAGCEPCSGTLSDGSTSGDVPLKPKRNTQCRFRVQWQAICGDSAMLLRLAEHAPA